MINDDKFDLGADQIRFSIGAEGESYLFSIECREKNIAFKFRNKKDPLLYSVLAPYSCAKLHPENKL